MFIRDPRCIRCAVLALLLVGCPAVRAQDATPAPAGLSASDINALVGRIALYPDVLLAQILPAATYPIEIVQAARWVKANPGMAKLEEQTWDLSVMAVCKYPKVLAMMNEDLDWTNALGAAFLDQPDDVMDAIQRLRAEAEAAGNLQTTPQQTVVHEQTYIRIVPTKKEVVYVPRYDPKVVYVSSAPTTVVVNDDDDDDGAAVAAAAISFGAGVALGAWLNHDCDWHSHGVVYCRPGYWGGYAHRGVVAWGNGWAAGRGPRRGFVAGNGRGVAVGPHGAAVWNNGHGAAWRRNGVVGRPVYTGRYAGYNNRARSGRQLNNRRNYANNRIGTGASRGRIDRGNRPGAGGRGVGDGGRRAGDGGRRAGDGGRRAGDGGRRAGDGGRRAGDGGRRAGDGGRQRPSTGSYGRRTPASPTRRAADRGRNSRGSDRGSSAGRSRQATRKSPSRTNRSSARSSSHRSAYSGNRGSRNVGRSSSRGSRSRRSSGMRRGGGGHRGGGGRRR